MIKSRPIRSLLGKVGLGCVVALLGWANWQEPNLHDYSAPVSVGALRVAGLQPGPAAGALRARLLRLPGITACTVRADAQAIAYTYHPDEITPTQMQQQVSAGFRAQEYHAPVAPAVGPQCPVPVGYLTALERVRFALNLRRLFVKV